MKKPKVSIIIPCFNSEKYINECLDSILNQTIKNIEIICVNDGSTDNTKKILEDYQRKYRNIKIINQTNQGVVLARANGLKNALGEYIGWVDCDDFVDSQMYEQMYKKAIDDNLDVVICNYNFYPYKNCKKEKWYKSYNGKVDYNFLQNNTILWNKIVKKDLLDKLNAVDLLCQIGEGFYSLVLINAKKIGTIDKCLYNYRIGHNSLSSNTNKVEWFEKVVVHQKLKLEYVKSNNYDNKWIYYFKYQYLYYSELLMIIAAKNNRKDLYLENKKIIKSNNFPSKRYSKYLKNNISFLKRIFFRIAPYSYIFTKTISKLML